MSKYIVLLTNIFVLSILLQRSFHISIEYFYDEDFLNNSGKPSINNPNVRRTFPNKYSSKVNLDNLFSEINSFRKENINIGGNFSSEIAATSYQSSKEKKTHKDVLRNVQKSTISSECPRINSKALVLKTFEDYDYTDEVIESINESIMLRQKDDEKIQKTTSITHKQSSIEKISTARFYNLEPAINQEIDIGKINELDNNMWYVPQDFPCWDLPILYGEMGRKTKKSDVFLIYGGNLVNVIDHWIKDQSSFKAGDPPMSHVINKWCGTRPCYGDHTLCLFPNKDVSKICDKGYKVHVPTILDQFIITNTLNAMRNRVAHGLASIYSHLPTASNMKQITYDYDLEKIGEAWLRQCLPGTAPCSALDGDMVSQLECTKYMKYCCLNNLRDSISQCTPKQECYIHPVIGCIHIWFSSAGKDLSITDVRCGRTSVKTFNAVQLLWAKTSKIGCAYGRRSNGDTRVVCNFSPGAPFYLETKLFCGIISHNDIIQLRNNENLTKPIFLSSLGIKWHSLHMEKPSTNSSVQKGKVDQDRKSKVISNSIWGVDSLTKVYKEGWVRKQLNDLSNGTRSMVARLVARYSFIDETESRCDSDISIYEVGHPGALCVERGRTYNGLCYDYRDPTPGYRFIAIAAPIALFSLILYDLFSGVIRQTIYLL